MHARRRSTILAFATLLAACGGPRSPRAATATADAPDDHPHVVVVSIDGMMAETYLEPDRLGLRIPTLRALRDRGAYARVESVFPTVTYPAHVTMMTGVPPARHRITTNRAPDPLDRNKQGWRWYAEDIAVPTLWQAVAAAHRPVAIVTWPVTVGADVAFRVPEYWRVGTPDDQKLLRALSTPGLLARVEQADPTLWKSLVPPDVKDAAQFAIARHLIANERVDLMLVHGWELDDAQHDHGPGSREAKQAIENADRLLGELLAAIDRSAARDRTYVVVVSDHGFAPIEHEIRPYVLLAERGLVAPLPDKVTADTPVPKVAISANGGIAFVYLNESGVRSEVADALAALPNVAQILGRADIAAAGGDPDAEFALVAAPTYAFSEQRAAPLVVDTPGRGTHGYPPTDPAMAASFLAIGPGIARRDLGTIRMIDLAPTFARWLGVALPEATGEPLDL